MRNMQGYIVASLSVCSAYVFYVYIYRAHQVLKTNVHYSDKLPGLVYLYLKYLRKALTRRTGCMYTTQATRKREAVYTVLNCRLDIPVLRRFCSAAGYGWDYPDTEYRDVPLCFPECLFSRLLLMLLTDDNFSLSPAGLVRVRQSLKTHQPIDELKKGPFTLRVQVQEYRQTDVGVEVDICLFAASRSGSPVWESVLTMLSRNKLHGDSRCSPDNENKSQPEELAAEDVKQVELRVPRTTGLWCVRSFSDYFPHRLLSLLGRFLGFRSQTAPSLWMLSVCLAEIEKHKGVEVITAPVNVTAQFKEPLLIPGNVTIRFWEANQNGSQSSAQSLCFHMEQQGHSVPHIEGLISRS